MYKTVPQETVDQVETALLSTPGSFFLSTFSVIDCIFTPFLERMAASLFYYKGFTLRDPIRYPAVEAWFKGTSVFVGGRSRFT